MSARSKSRATGKARLELIQSPLQPFGKLFIVLGVALVLIGLLLSFARSSRIGNLPGDLNWSGRGWQVSFPLATSILLSIVLTILLNLFLRRR